VRWDAGAAATPHGQLLFFAEFLAATGVFDRWVAECPLSYLSGNAPDKRDVLGSLMLGLLAGHRRYAHITALRGDAVAAQALGMNKVVSEDALRRPLERIEDGCQRRCGAVQGAGPLGPPAALHRRPDRRARHRPAKTAARGAGLGVTAGFRVIGWGNAVAEGGRVNVTLGCIKGRAPRDAVFKREPEAELERLDVSLRPLHL
jgi:hypothetical protein